MIVHIDGEFAPEGAVAVNDGAVLFGDTLFETLLARRRELRFLSDHLDRIEFSAILLDFPFDRSAAEKALGAVAQRLDAPASRLRLTVTRGPFDTLALPPAGRARLIVTAVPYREPTKDERAAGVRCILAPNLRVNPLSHLPQMKRGACADILYAADHARRLKAREALFVSERGELLEGATSNLFLLRDGVLVTPPAGSLVLPGIARRRALQAAARLKIPTRERDLLLPELYAADEVFLTNALIGLLPVAEVDGRPLSRGPRALEIFAEMERSP